MRWHDRFTPGKALFHKPLEGVKSECDHTQVSGPARFDGPQDGLKQLCGDGVVVDIFERGKTGMQKKPSLAQIMKQGLWDENPVLKHTLGICSTLAVTNLLVNTIVMNIGLIFTLTMSCLTVSVLRKITPMRIRMMVQTLIISSYVIVFDMVIKGYLPDISEALGPYVGLIITNCIIMGRCETFARSNPPWPSFLDGLAVGVGFALVLFAIAVVRELLGFGTLLGYRIMPTGFTPWTIMIMAPGAFFTLSIYVWLVRSYSGLLDKQKP